MSFLSPSFQSVSVTSSLPVRATKTLVPFFRRSFACAALSTSARHEFADSGSGSAVVGMSKGTFCAWFEFRATVMRVTGMM